MCPACSPSTPPTPRRACSHSPTCCAGARACVDAERGGSGAQGSRGAAAQLPSVLLHFTNTLPLHFFAACVSSVDCRIRRAPLRCSAPVLGTASSSHTFTFHVLALAPPIPHAVTNLAAPIYIHLQTGTGGLKMGAGWWTNDGAAGIIPRHWLNLLYPSLLLLPISHDKSRSTVARHCITFTRRHGHASASAFCALSTLACVMPQHQV